MRKIKEWFLKFKFYVYSFLAGFFALSLFMVLDRSRKGERDKMIKDVESWSLDHKKDIIKEIGEVHKQKVHGYTTEVIEIDEKIKEIEKTIEDIKTSPDQSPRRLNEQLSQFGL